MPYTKILEQFKKRTVVVIGDVMLDKYLWGNVERISPEAPVPIVHVQKESYVAGGAANVANNIVALGGKAVIIGVVGNDEAGKVLEQEVKKEGMAWLLVPEERPTIQKVRVISHNQQLMRIDYEDINPVNHHVERHVLDFLKKLPHSDIIVVSDYAKGLVTKKLMDEVVAFSHMKKIPLMVDPKPSHMSYYKGASLITPNLKEAREMSRVEGSNDAEVESMGKELQTMLHADVLITRGKDGMTLVAKEEVKHIPTTAKEVYDVSGAGDTVVAALALSVAAGASLAQAASIANHAAGVVVAKVGTATVSVDELRKSMEQ